MRKKKIKLLTAYCYKNNQLDEKKVFDIAKHLKRRDLKKFVKELKYAEAKKNVMVTLPLQNYNKELFARKFPDKNILFKYDPGLILGVKIEYNNNVYDFSLKNILEKESSFIKNYYD